MHGFTTKTNKGEFFHPNGYLYGAGSVSPHIDDTNHATVAVLVATENLAPDLDSNNNYCELVTRDQCLSIKKGDVFIFDGSKKHAWIANCRWVIAFQDVTIKKNF
jgi:hypothetical protein